MKKDKSLRWFATTKEATTKILNIIATTAGKTSIQLPDISVLFFIINKMDYDNKAKLPTQKEIGKQINLSPRRISMAITKLQKYSFIAKTSEAKTYYINPFYFYIGDYRDLHSKYETWKKLTSNTQQTNLQLNKKKNVNNLFTNNSTNTSSEIPFH